MTFDKKISLSALLQVLAMLGTVIGAWMALDRKVQASEARMAFVDERQKEHEERESKRLERIEEKLDKLLEKRER